MPLAASTSAFSRFSTERRVRCMLRSCRASFPSARRALSLCSYTLESACARRFEGKRCGAPSCGLPRYGVRFASLTHLPFEQLPLLGVCLALGLMRFVAHGHHAGCPPIKPLLGAPKLAPELRGTLSDVLPHSWDFQGASPYPYLAWRPLLRGSSQHRGLRP